MSDKIWNGGTTNKSKEKAIREWNKMIRQSEDYLDGVDVENQDIKERINKDMDKPCRISGVWNDWSSGQEYSRAVRH